MSRQPRNLQSGGSYHVHYSLEPREPEDLPKIMHFLELTRGCASIECLIARGTWRADRYKPKEKTASHYRWGSQLLAGLKIPGKG